ASGDRAALERAAALYTGDLLPHDPYEDWAFHHRQRLQLRYRAVLRALGDHGRLVELDPTDEAAHLGLMQELMAGGDRAGVLRRFEVLERVLAAELDVGPSDEAIALRDLAGGAPEASVPPDRGRPRSATLARQRVGFCTTRDGI